MIRKKKRGGRLVIDLTGPQGNAFYLMGMAQELCRKIGKDPEPLIKEMKSKDYEHLIKVFDREFGAFVILER